MTRLIATLVAIATVIISSTAVAAPTQDTFRAKVSDAAGEGIRGAYVCVTSDAPDVCALADGAGLVEIPATSGTVTMEVVASTMGPVSVTLLRRARTTTVACEKTFASHQGQHAVMRCTFEG